MKTAKPIAILGLALAVLLAGQLAPSSASANWLEPGPGPRHFRALIMELARKRTPQPDRSTFFLPELDLKTKSGYRVSVLGFGETVALAVQRGSSSGTAYLVRGTATRQRLQASFGALGSISMRFRPAPGQPPTRRSCRGHRFLSQRGVYVGKLRFRGEGGYVSVDARRAKGTIREIVHRCSGSDVRPRPAALAANPSPEGRFGPERPFLAAHWRHGITSVEFAALGARKGRNAFLVDTATTQGRMAILRLALLFRAKGVFTHDDQLTFARVAPPAPFHGAGTYRAAPDGTKTWSGKLTVDFPGLPRFPLTGPPFEVEFGLVPADPLSLF